MRFPAKTWDVNMASIRNKKCLFPGNGYIIINMVKGTERMGTHHEDWNVDQWR